MSCCSRSLPFKLLLRKLTGLISIVVHNIRGCDHCKKHYGVRHQPSMTMYHWDGTGKNPNEAGWLCTDCRFQYEQFWQSNWDDYNSMRY